MASLPLASRKPWQTGDKIGRYTLLAKLAIGGMAEIWLARQTGLRGFEKLVVIKKISDAFTDEPEFVEMFLDEARIAAQLHHPHIVQLYDLGEQEGAYYIAMEYLPGEHLAAVARAGSRVKRPLPLAYAVRLIANAADGLGHAHTQAGLDGKPLNIVHRDVSPQNLIVTYDGSLKLVDFGIAKAANRVSRTSSGRFKGKAAYMSPEQARGIALDARSDLFSLGIVLFEAVTSSRLFHYEDPLAAFAVIAGTDPFPKARERNPQVPAALEALISKALERDPDQRFQSAKAFQSALEEWLRGQGDAPTTTDIAEYMRLLFDERIRLKARVLEAAVVDDTARATFGPPPLQDVERSMPEDGHRLHQGRFSWVLWTVALALMLSTAYGVTRLLRFVAARSAPAAVQTLGVETEPQGARIAVDSLDRGLAPTVLEGLTPGEHQVSASLEGYQPTSRKVVLLPGERQQLVLSLTPLPRPPEPASPSPPPPQPLAEPLSPVEPGPQLGLLSLDTVPWTAVYLNGRKIGETPLFKTPLPPGRQTLQLVNDDAGIKRRIEVHIEAGRTTVKKLKL